MSRLFPVTPLHYLSTVILEIRVTHFCTYINPGNLHKFNLLHNYTNKYSCLSLVQNFLPFIAFLLKIQVLERYNYWLNS